MSLDIAIQKTLASAARVFSLDIVLRSDNRRVVLYGRPAPARA